MATTTKLVLKMGTTGGAKNYSFNYADDTTSSATVKSAVQAIITNGTLFNPQPVNCSGAKFVTTTETEVDIS